MADNAGALPAPGTVMADASAPVRDSVPVPSAAAPVETTVPVMVSAPVLPVAYSETDPPEQAASALTVAIVDVTAGRSEVLRLLAADEAATVYDNIWDRLRAGFELEPLESPLIERHERWFLEHDEFRAEMLERARRYLYYIVEEIDERGMPLEIALLPAIESAYKPYAYSRARASGLWQFIPSTGRLYGLKTNWWYDGRRDVVASTRAALDYLEKLIEDFDGDWHLALAAYNGGEGRVGRAIRWNRARGLPTDFEHLRRIKRETKHYVPKLQAMINLVSHPDRYGIELPHIPNAPYFAVVEADSQVDLGVIARLTGMDVDELHYINPGYRRWATHPNGPHHLLIPVDKKDALIAGLNSLPEEERVQWVHHRVRRGDTLYDIARYYGVTVRAIMRANGLHSDLLRIGQRLVLPVSATAVHASADTSRPILHKVRRGETLSEIARRYGVLVRQLAEWNLMDPEDVLHMGRRLKIWINSGPQVFHDDSDAAAHA